MSLCLEWYYISIYNTTISSVLTMLLVNLYSDKFWLYNSHHQGNVKHSLDTYMFFYVLHWSDDGCYTAKTRHHIVN